VTSPTGPSLPIVSVVVTCYDYARYLEECVESVALQTGVDWEVLIVDDASSDDSWQIAQRLADRYERVTARRNRTNRGMIPTINDAMWSVDGTYIVKLDADDMLTPGSLRRSVELLEAHPDVTFAYGRPLRFRGSPPPARTRSGGWILRDGADWVRMACARGGNLISQPEALVRTRALRDAGHFTVDLPHTSDLEMWLRLAALGRVGFIRDADQGWYRMHDQSMQNTVHRGHLVDFRERLKAFETFFAGPGRELPGGAQALATARRAVAVDALGHACSAYRRGSAGQEPVEDYVAFAREVYPDVVGLAAWRELELRRGPGGPATGPSQLIRPSLLIGPAMRHWRHRRAERRLRTTGV
jgi:GT2 family glycosyltransferase